MKIEAFTKTYEGVTVLDFPGMELEQNKIYAVIGANGSGKSTFAKILAHILPGDKNGTFTDAATCGYMPQKNYAFRMTVKKNILLNGAEAPRAYALMDALHLRHLENKRADRLSGGETARMALDSSKGSGSRGYQDRHSALEGSKEGNTRTHRS